MYKSFAPGSQHSGEFLDVATQDTLVKMNRSIPAIDCRDRVVRNHTDIRPVIDVVLDITTAIRRAKSFPSLLNRIGVKINCIYLFRYFAQPFRVSTCPRRQFQHRVKVKILDQRPNSLVLLRLNLRFSIREVVLP